MCRFGPFQTLKALEGRPKGIPNQNLVSGLLGLDSCSRHWAFSPLHWVPYLVLCRPSSQKTRILPCSFRHFRTWALIHRHKSTLELHIGLWVCIWAYEWKKTESTVEILSSVSWFLGDAFQKEYINSILISEQNNVFESLAPLWFHSAFFFFFWTLITQQGLKYVGTEIQGK